MQDRIESTISCSITGRVSIAMISIEFTVAGSAFVFIHRTTVSRSSAGAGRPEPTLAAYERQSIAILHETPWSASTGEALRNVTSNQKTVPASARRGRFGRSREAGSLCRVRVASGHCYFGIVTPRRRQSDSPQARYKVRASWRHRRSHRIFGIIRHRRSAMVAVQTRSPFRVKVGEAQTLP
jgi:hypothetical protein